MHLLYGKTILSPLHVVEILGEKCQVKLCLKKIENYHRKYCDP